MLASPGVVFLGLALAIVGPLMTPGYLFALDSPLALNQYISGYFWGTSDGASGVFAATYNSAPIALALKALDGLLPGWLVQRLYLVLLFWLCGLGGSRLPYVRGPARYYAGVFYAVNPFTCIRFVTGQWGVLGAYALAPFAVAAFVGLLERPGARNAVSVALWLTLTGFMQVHGLALALGLLAALLVGRCALEPGAARRCVPALALAAGLFVALNLFWVLRAALASGGVADVLPVAELDYFAARPPLAVLSLRGFWLSSRYVDPASVIPGWWLLLLAALYLAALGTVALLRDHALRWLGVALVTALLLSAFLAAGPGTGATAPLFRLMWEHVPGYAAFRDSHKFVAVLALGYAWLGALGLQAASDRRGEATRGLRAPRAALPAVAALLPVALGLPVFGAWGQLRPADYPGDWHEARAILDRDSGDYAVLFLPWHMYMDMPWLQNRWRRVASPAPAFFERPAIYGDNLEIAPVSSDSTDPVSAYIEFLLEQSDTLRHFGAHIAPLNARYVVLLHTADYDSYDFLGRQTDLEPVLEGQTISLFRNLSYAGGAYSVNQVVNVRDWSHYLELASGGAGPAGTLYLLGDEALQTSSQTPAGTGSGEGVSLIRQSPVSYRVSVAQEGYLVFPLPQHVAREGWTYEGRPALLHLGLTPAFPVGPGTGTISYSRFYQRDLPAYALALAALAVALAAWLKDRASEQGK